MLNESPTFFKFGNRSYLYVHFFLLWILI